MSDRILFYSLNPLGRVAVTGCNAIQLLVLSVNEPLVSAAKPHRVLHQGVQHWLKVERRTADDLEYICGCNLLLPRLSKLPLRLNEFAGPLIELLFETSRKHGRSQQLPASA